MLQEGVIKFQYDHCESGLDSRVLGDAVCALVAWREIMAHTLLVGQNPKLYDGAGYGNVSIRTGAPSAGFGRRQFLITGTQTSGNRCITLDDFCIIEEYDSRRNWVRSRGRIKPSSETMTHGTIYDLSASVRVVLHAHTPVIWRRREQLRLPTTDAGVAYGTPEMAAEVRRLYRSTSLAESRVFAMGGHEDGIVAFGRSPAEAGQVLLGTLARAYALQCKDQGIGLCRVS